MDKIIIKDWILPKSKARSGKKLRRFSGVTIHETANEAQGATAKNHAVYMNLNGGKNAECSYHYVVDEQETYHLLPDNEVAWHAGDGAEGKGNNETIALEICVNREGNFARAVSNAAVLTACLLYENGVHTARAMVFTHRDFSPWKKDCPHNLLAGKAGGMAQFITAVQTALDVLWNDALQPPDVATPSVPQKLYKVQVGAFSSESAARAYAEKVRKAGFDSFLVDAKR
ncbi:MAG: N-acetylmuramoyl-L-alanine amidase [Pygmaiobacter sp.]